MSQINPPNAAMVGNDLRPTPEWYRFFVALGKDTDEVAASVDYATLFNSGAAVSRGGEVDQGDTLLMAPPSAPERVPDMLPPVFHPEPANDVLPPISVERINIDDTIGLVEQTGFDSFAKRAIGAASATDVLTRSDGDARYPQIGGPLSLSTRTITATGSPIATDYLILCDATLGAITVNLPAAASNAGRILIVKKIDVSVNAVTIDGNASETIDGATTQAILTQYSSLTVQCDGSAWYLT